jgi:SAM-dependent methyltransferase
VTTLYECPEYYDILFGWDRDAEAQTYDRALAEHGIRRGGRLLEVAAGTAQVGVRLAHLGWCVTALDLSEAMLAFASTRAQHSGVRLITQAADMRSFGSIEKFHGALNPMSSFRMLQGDTEVADHLKCMADALMPGSVYLIDMAFGTDGTAESDLDEWVMNRDGITITATTSNVRVEDAPQGLNLMLDWHEALRPYTPESFAAAVERCDRLRLAGCYPEVEADADISRFADVLDRTLPSAGRAIVVLSRT